VSGDLIVNIRLIFKALKLLIFHKNIKPAVTLNRL
jgi:hypothetical protein